MFLCKVKEKNDILKGAKFGPMKSLVQGEKRVTRPLSKPSTKGEGFLVSEETNQEQG